MSRTRALLHLNKLDDFAAWAATKGWEREPTKSHYEVLRLRKPGKTKRGKRKPIILYRHEGGDHATIGRDQAPAESLVKQWLSERKQREETQ
jgi:hypothetical protein